MALTKAELAEALFDELGLNKREAKDMVETFFDEIRNALERAVRNQRLTARGFTAQTTCEVDRSSQHGVIEPAR